MWYSSGHPNGSHWRYHGQLPSWLTNSRAGTQANRRYRTSPKAGGVLSDYPMGGSEHAIPSAHPIGDRGMGEGASQPPRPREGIISIKWLEEWISHWV